MELIIVVGIMIILISISISVFNGVWEKEKLSSVVRDIVTDIRYAQQLAITEQIYYGVRFISIQNGQDKYELFKYSSSTVSEIIQSKNLPDGINFQSITFSNDLVFFNPYGAANEQGFVVLTSNASNTSTIEVEPSGFVKILE